MTKTQAKYTLPTTPLTLSQKVGQLFMPAVFINDTEEETNGFAQGLRQVVNNEVLRKYRFCPKDVRRAVLRYIEGVVTPVFHLCSWT